MHDLGKVQPRKTRFPWKERVRMLAMVGVHHGQDSWGGCTHEKGSAKYTLEQSHNKCTHNSVSALDPIRTSLLRALGPK